MSVDHNRILYPIQKMKVVDRGRDFNTRNYFLFVILLVVLIKFGKFGFPSMPKRKIIENKLIQV